MAVLHTMRTFSKSQAHTSRAGGGWGRGQRGRRSSLQKGSSTSTVSPTKRRRPSTCARSATLSSPRYDMIQFRDVTEVNLCCHFLSMMHQCDRQLAPFAVMRLVFRSHAAMQQSSTHSRCKRSALAQQAHTTQPPLSVCFANPSIHRLRQPAGQDRDAQETPGGQCGRQRSWPQRRRCCDARSRRRHLAARWHASKCCQHACGRWW